MTNNFKQRLFFSTLFLIILTGAIYLSSFPLFQPFFTLLVMAVAAIALWEYYHIPKSKGVEPQCSIGIVGSICYLYTLFHATISDHKMIGWPLAMLALILFALFIYYLFFGKDPLVNSAVTFFGIVYITVPLGALIPINFLFGPFWLVYLLIVTKITDIAAYFIGKKWGKFKLAPIVSPKKTWEGAIGGFLAAILASILLYLISEDFTLKTHFSFYASLWLGGLLGVLGQLGDLFESLLKRDCGVKDSSRLPGLGGILDIIDSLIFTTPMLYLFLIWL